MKLTKYFMPFAALAVLASCSNDKFDGPAIDAPQSEGTMAAMFKVSLPSLADTRVITASDFEDGDLSEYKVNDVTFYIFKVAGSSEDEYKYIAKSDTFYPLATADDNKDITRTATITVQFPQSESDSLSNSSGVYYYGLCVINKPTSGSFEPSDGQTFGEWKKVSTYSLDNFKHSNGFTMTNAPTYTSANSDVLSGVTTLVKLDASKFVKSPANPSESAGTFYVQRGVAKVKIGMANGVTDWKLKSTVSNDQHFLLENWALDVTNTKSFPVQNVDSLALTMAAAKAVKSNIPWFYTTSSSSDSIKFNHIWWAEDPNYGTTVSAADFTKVSSVSYAVSGSGNVLSDYCLENTMPYYGQSQEQTTRVVFKGKYSLDGTTYSDFIVAANDEAINITSELLKSNVTAGHHKLTDVINHEEYTHTADKDKFVDYADSDGKLYNDVVIARKLGVDVATAEVDYYPRGVTYYVARIKHFNPSNETDWTAPENATPSSTAAQLYNAGHTGRYGMLRNNVYYVNVNNVLGYGSPTIPNPTPDPGDTPDPDDEIDPVKYNMMVEINVLAWAKRNYDYDLK